MCSFNIDIMFFGVDFNAGFHFLVERRMMGGVYLGMVGGWEMGF